MQVCECETRPACHGSGEELGPVVGVDEANLHKHAMLDGKICRGSSGREREGGREVRAREGQFRG